MPLKELEARYATRRTRDYKLADGEGLYLLVRPNGSKLWRTITPARKGCSLLASIQASALRRRGCAAPRPKWRWGQERDPGARNKPQAVMSFEEVARAWHRHRLPRLDGGHAARLLARLERDAFPALGKTDLTSVTPADVLAMVRAVEARGSLDVSRRLKQHVSQIYHFAIPHGWATADPAEHLEQLLAPKPKTQHMARVASRELPVLVRAIDCYDGEDTPKRRAVTRAALLFTLLTWARTNETRLASWDEVEALDGPEPLWRVPAARMKMAREHLVPLSAQAVAILKAMQKVGGEGYIFPGEKPQRPLSQNTMIYACYRMGYRGRQTVHGFRGLASTWANEAECYRPDWIEMALAHAERDEVRGAYNSALYLTPRRRMLEAWADHLAAMLRHDTPKGESALAATQHH